MGPSLSLTYKTPLESTLEILARITFVFVSSNATLNIFVAVPFRIHTPLSSARGEAIVIFLCSECTKKIFSYVNRFANTMKISWVPQDDV